MISLITLATAKAHLRITTTDHDFDIENKMLQASAIILNHIKLQTVPAEWLIGSPVTVDAPYDIQCWTLIVLGELFHNRESSISNPLSDAVRRGLETYWGPTIA